MRIVVLHRSVTHRKIFKNVLRKGGFENILSYPNPKAALDAVSAQIIDLAIVEKELLGGNASRRREQPIQSLLTNAGGVLITSYQFTKEEIVDLLGQADEILLMPFGPDTLQQKVAAFQNGSQSRNAQKDI